MNILSDFKNDIRSLKKRPGGYEWWYFDAVDFDSDTRFVIIFYEGNPFSPRYIRALENDTAVSQKLPACFPAVSISVYQNGKTVYYSFTDFAEEDIWFDSQLPCFRFGPHEMRGKKEGDIIMYEVTLDETLPTGCGIWGKFSFQSHEVSNDLFDDIGDSQLDHTWNLTQPKAEVRGELKLLKEDQVTHHVNFRGTGYHDHNMGQEPMFEEFDSWYWGRFHFEECTLIYYVINRKSGNKYQAWLIRSDNSAILHKFNEVHILDKQLSLFGLKSARRVEMSNEDLTVTIQQRVFLDNGPFYQRYISDAFLAIPDHQILEHARGITEYIQPERIHWQIFWPLVNMRIRFNKNKPHWVQKSDTLYRWTW